MKILLTFSLALAASTAAFHTQAGEPEPLQRQPMWYHHASTAQEGTLRGAADYLSAQGENAVNRAYAAYVAQQAQRLSLQVKQERIQARWQVKENYAQRTYGKRVSAEAVTRINKARLPERLPVGAVDSTGKSIQWPAVLQEDSFATHRHAFEEALTLRASGVHGRNSQSHTSATRARNEMLATLRGQIHVFNPMQYTAARRFIESLAYETLFPPQAQLSVK